MNEKNSRLKKKLGTKGPIFPISRYWILFFIGMAIAIRFILEVIPSIKAYQADYMHFITMVQSLIEAAMYISAFIFASLNLRNIWGNFLAAVLIYFQGDFVFQIIERPNTYTLALLFWWFFILVGLVVLVFTLLRFLAFLIEFFNKLSKKRYDIVARMKSLSKKNHHAILIGLITATSLAVSYFTVSSKNFGVEITIQPKNYQIEFRFWGRYSPEWYLNHPNGTKILDQLNKHHAVIQNALFSIHDDE
ncbi:MAG: hypothetical protein ACTSWN_14630, partial [Promethearchaeota archaeon]